MFKNDRKFETLSTSAVEGNFLYLALSPYTFIFVAINF